MTYEEKKEYALNFILAGLEVEEAFYHAEMTEKEVKDAMDDKDLEQKIEFIFKQEHIRLRELFKDTVELSAKQRLDWRAVLSLLEVTFPNKYKNKNIELPIQKVLLLSKDDEKL
jgi:hypothetical protein